MNKWLVFGITGGVVLIIGVGVAVWMFSKTKETPKVSEQVLQQKMVEATEVAEAPPPPAKIVVAARDIPANVVITMDMLTFKLVPYPQPAGTETDKNKIAGNRTKSSIPKSSPVKTGDLFRGE